MIEPAWVTGFLDLPASSYDAGVRFWRDVTGYAVSPPRGTHREFATLVPPSGDAYLRVQRVRDGGAGIHLDLHVEDPRAAAGVAASLGAVEVADRGYVVMRSPGGLAFCLVPGAESVRPKPAVWPDGTSSLVDQVCLDIPAGSYDEECGFWEAITGWSLRASPARPEFRVLVRPPGMPLRFLLQRLDERSGVVRAHLDVASDDRAGEVRRHVLLGARLDAEREHWTVLRDPAGSPYCVTDRDPVTGLLA